MIGQAAGTFFNAVGDRIRSEAITNEILRVRVGSFLYGTETPDSDTDYYSVWIPSLLSMVGLKDPAQIHEEGEENGREFEITRYPVNLIVRHMLKCNPNMLEVFYADDLNVVQEHPLGRRLRSNPHIFLSSRACYKTFRGYAHEQRKKLLFKRERLQNFEAALAQVGRWMDQRLVVLPETLTIRSELNEEGSWRSFEKGFDLAETAEKLRTALAEYGWRKDLIKAHGFDVKFAANLIRILGESFDLFKFGEIRFPLSTRDSLREIRAGKWTLEQVLACANEWERRVDEAFAVTTMPPESNYKAAEDLLVGIMAEWWATHQDAAMLEAA